MGLFNRFTNTVFLKEDSELENKVNKLEELSVKYPNNKKIKNDLYLAKMGLHGENNIKFELEHANIGMYVLHDITLKYHNLTSQIDYIIITPARIYFVECKNLIGTIIVDEYGNFERKLGNYENKFIYSPMTQAERHIDNYKKIWKENHSKFDNFLFEKYLDKWTIPIVVIANDETKLDIKNAPKDIQSRIMKSDQLVRYLKNDIKIQKIDLSNQKDMKNIAERFLEFDSPIYIDYEEEYVKNEDIKNAIKEKLLDFRSIKARARGISDDYVFTNDELNSILDILPKSIDDLKKVLPEVKCKFHGQEIIDLINKNI